MPNKRASHVKRFTITIDEETLRVLENSSAAQGMDRLEFIREAIAAKLKRDAESEKKDTKPNNKTK